MNFVELDFGGCFGGKAIFKGLESQYIDTAISYTTRTKGLFPLNGAGRFGGDVVDHAVDALDLVDDAVGDGAEQIAGQVAPVGGHGVATVNNPQGDNAFIGALVAHDADGFERQQHGE